MDNSKANKSSYIRYVNSRKKHFMSDLNLTSICQDLNSESEKETSAFVSSSRINSSITTNTSNGVLKNFLLSEILVKKTKKRIALPKRKKLHLNISKFMKYPKTVFNVMAFLKNDKELIAFYNSTTLFRDLIKKYLKKVVVEKIKKPFMVFYRRYLDLKSCAVVVSKKDKFYIQLIFLVQINIEDMSSQNYTISNYYSYQALDKMLKNYFEFNCNNGVPLNSFWIHYDISLINQSDIIRPEVMQILPFRKGDTFSISFNLFSCFGFINFDKFRWERMKISKERRSRMSIDKMKVVWRVFEKEEADEYVVIKLNGLVKNLYPVLLLKEAKVANIGHYVIKATFYGAEKGSRILSKKFNIMVKGRNDRIRNEVKKNDLVYDSEFCKEIQIRKGDLLTIYYSLNDNTQYFF